MRSLDGEGRMIWREFWDGEHKVFVNARHRLLYFEAIANEVAAFISSPDAMVLDYGCGEALAAELLAAKCGHLYLYDSAPKIEAGLRKRYAETAKISVLSTDDLAALPDSSLDLFVCHSIFQYLSPEECRKIAALAAKKLKLGGKILVSDVMPPHVDTVADSMALLDFAYRGGFFFAALRGLALRSFSKYGRLRSRVALTTFTIPDMLRLLSIEGFEARRLEQNIGHNRARMTFIGKRL
ncbi:MAG: methyltransferase domain-containing protein [Methylovirgula sp.]